MIKNLKRLKKAIFTKIRPTSVPIIKIVEEKNILKNKKILIVGGTGGIGLAIAKKFSKVGGSVIITGRDEKKLKKCCNDIGNNCKYFLLDLSDIENFNLAVEKIFDKFGLIDIFVNAAGVHVSREGLTFLNTTIDEYDLIMDTNLKSSYFFAQQIVKKWIKEKVHGHILFISSQSALEPSWSPYRLSKLGLSGITEGLAQELLQYGIIVNAIGPGPTATSMQKLYNSKNIYTDDNNINRFTLPDEIAEYATLLVSNLGDTIVGQTIYMSGGRGIIDKR